MTLTIHADEVCNAVLYFLKKETLYYHEKKYALEAECGADGDVLVRITTLPDYDKG